MGLSISYASAMSSTDHSKWQREAVTGLNAQAQRFDVDKDGFVSLRESEPLRAAMGVDPSNWQDVWSGVDRDRDGRQTPREVAQFFATVEASQPAVSGMPNPFNLRNNDPYDGVIKPEEFTQFGEFLNKVIFGPNVRNLNGLKWQIGRAGTMGTPYNAHFPGNVFSKEYESGGFAPPAPALQETPEYRDYQNAYNALTPQERAAMPSPETLASDHQRAMERLDAEQAEFERRLGALTPSRPNEGIARDIQSGKFEDANWQQLDRSSSSAPLLDSDFVKKMTPSQMQVWALTLGSAGTHTNDGTLKTDVVDFLKRNLTPPADGQPDARSSQEKKAAWNLLRGMLHTWEIRHDPASGQWSNKWGDSEGNYGPESREILRLAQSLLQAQGATPAALKEPDYQVK